MAQRTSAATRVLVASVLPVATQLLPRICLLPDIWAGPYLYSTYLQWAEEGRRVGGGWVVHSGWVGGWWVDGGWMVRWWMDM